MFLKSALKRQKQNSLTTRGNLKFISLKYLLCISARTEKRSVTPDGCSLYRETLTELFEIVKEEAKHYDECLEREGRNKKSLFLL